MKEQLKKELLAHTLGDPDMSLEETAAELTSDASAMFATYFPDDRAEEWERGMRALAHLVKRRILGDEPAAPLRSLGDPKITLAETAAALTLHASRAFAIYFPDDWEKGMRLFVGAIQWECVSQLVTH